MKPEGILKPLSLGGGSSHKGFIVYDFDGEEEIETIDHPLATSCGAEWDVYKTNDEDGYSCWVKIPEVWKYDRDKKKFKREVNGN